MSKDDEMTVGRIVFGHGPKIEGTLVQYPSQPFVPPVKELDYKSLLSKYMTLVKDCEGVTFVEYIDNDGCATEGEVQFSPLEFAALRNMHDEVCDE